MSKLFVVSDVHSFYTPLKEALEEAGFDSNNKDHWLISCGDLFDRGLESVEVLKYIMNLPNKVLIKGNHEYLLDDLLDRKYAYDIDDSNGTTKTVLSLGLFPLISLFKENVSITKTRIKPYNNLLVNYFETKNYIFVHSCLPTIESESQGLYIPDNWRDSNQDWESATWGNPFVFYGEEHTGEIRELNKTVVFGHWHTSWPRNAYEGAPEFEPTSDFSCYYGDHFIGIDACTAYSKKVNVLVLEDDFIEV